MEHCKVKNCNKKHKKHNCRRCDNKDASHFSRKCTACCKAYACREKCSEHHCRICDDKNADHCSFYCTTVGGKKCKATGCVEEHDKHNCKSCGTPDSNHLSTNCPKPKGEKRCKAKGCAGYHEKHGCKLCGEKNANHRSNECPDATVLYHQTDKTAALAIIKTNEMRKGTAGLVGGGIYFATTEADTSKKAHSRGMMIKARVWLGKQYVANPKGENSLTAEQLKLKPGGPYDSVKVNRAGGIEHVIYDWGQASLLSVYPVS